ncbi:MAG: ferredoxin reductase family protein, partial [Chloroflexota bacterium]|nr:ferredoxin reductase family protein [Chloroflexota bacterium]
VLWPVPLVAVAEKPGGGTVLTVFAAGVGFVALTALVLQLVLPSRARTVTAPFGIDLLVRVHRGMGYAVLFLVLLHIVVLVLDDPARARLLDSIHAPNRARAGMVATLALSALVATSICRRRLRLHYERWRMLHLTLASLSLAGAFVHVLLVREYTATPVIRWALVALVGVAVVALFHLRVGRQFAAAGRPYVLTHVRAERNGAATLVLRAAGHSGIAFRPGQFAWIKLLDRPYSLAEHPFSYASSALDPARPSFTIGPAGDFSSGVGSLPAGTRLLLDGPHGSWQAALPDARYVLLAGGMGITPVLSMLRTWADAQDPRRVQFIFANRRWEQVPFREELERLRAVLNLDLVHVLSQPDHHWKGERGYIDAALLRRVLPDDARARNFFVCGPPPMVSGVESALRDIGIPRCQVHLERFASA